jgi:hypothetical protein
MRAGRIAAQHATEKRTHNPPYCYGLAARAGGIYNALACSGGAVFVGSPRTLELEATRPGLLGTPGLVSLVTL